MNTAVYSNAAGDITINNTLFKNIAVAININHKSAGVQNIAVTDCIFEDCSLNDSPQAASTKTYAAPIRIVAREDAKTNLVLKDITFIYSEGKENCGNGDILLGDGRNTAAETQGIVTLGMTGTDATVMVQQKGYYAADSTIADAAKAEATIVTESDVVVPNDANHFEVDKHDSIEVIGTKEATCTDEGYTGDKVCKVCGKVVEKGTVIEKTAHHYKDGKCTVCGSADPKHTGDCANLLWAVLVLASFGGLSVTLYCKRKTSRVER